MDVKCQSLQVAGKSMMGKTRHNIVPNSLQDGSSTDFVTCMASFGSNVESKSPSPSPFPSLFLQGVIPLPSFSLMGVIPSPSLSLNGVIPLPLAWQLAAVD